MSDFQTPETSGIVSQQSEAIIPLDEFKSFFYQLNAKPDTEIRLLPERKILELADIRSINEQVAAKLKNHEITAEVASINFVLSNRRIKDYSTWAEFDRENWDTVNEKIQTLSINWDILIKLPHYKLPQRHSMKLRVGSNIPPKDLFQLLLTSDDASQLIEAKTPSVCKVDFINNIIAAELLNIVSNWHEGLKDCPETNPVQTFLRKQGELLTQIIRYALPIALLSSVCLYSDYLLPVLGISNEVTTESLQKTLVFLVTVFIIGLFLGAKTEIFIDNKIGKFEGHPRFSITRGDKKAIEEYEKNNSKLTKQIFSRIFWIMFSLLFSSSLKFIIRYITKF